jgi:hypothetical protein
MSVSRFYDSLKANPSSVMKLLRYNRISKVSFARRSIYRVVLACTEVRLKFVRCCKPMTLYVQVQLTSPGSCTDVVVLVSNVYHAAEAESPSRILRKDVPYHSP